MKAALFRLWLVIAHGFCWSCSAAFHAGYRLPDAPNSTASPNPSSTSSGVMDTEIEADEAEPMDTLVVETVLFPAWVGCGKSRFAKAVAPTVPTTKATTPAIKLSSIPKNINSQNRHATGTQSFESSNFASSFPNSVQHNEKYDCGNNHSDDGNFHRTGALDLAMEPAICNCSLV